MSETRLDTLALHATACDEPFVLREDEFRLLYDRTSRGLWAYVYRLTRDSHTADDLLQETYYRFLRTPATYDGDLHVRNTLYRIATNLVRDRRRRTRPTVSIDHDETPVLAAAHDEVHVTGERTDVRRAMAQLRDRDQQLLWLAYAEGSSHQEIAASLGVRANSVKTLLFRARQRLAALLPRTTRDAGPGGRS
ncbi:MAG TPA: sigma-70 family RNA polymerase sigma factor [Luteitalea sp.]|nr:sigma-70 family RNA polymerase sigma factor [Luteitalea sp.]